MRWLGNRRVLFHNIHQSMNQVRNVIDQRDEIQIITMLGNTIVKSDNAPTTARMTTVRGRYVLQIDSDADIDEIQTVRHYPEPEFTPPPFEGQVRRV